MDLKRFSIGLSSIGVILLIAGLTIWLIRMPNLTDFRGGYYECLWSFTYRVQQTSLIRLWLKDPHRLFIRAGWNPYNVSCATAKNGWEPDLIRDPNDAKHKIDEILTGVPYKPPETPFFLMPPILNGLGLALLLLGGLTFFSRAQPPT